MALFGLFKKKEEKKPVSAAPLRPVEISPSRPAAMTRTFNVSGVTYQCKLDKEESRQDILSGVKDGDKLGVQIQAYKNSPSIMLIDIKSGLDIGFVPEKTVAEIFAKFSDPEIEVFVDDVDSFIPDDKDDEIYYCKVKLFVLKAVK